MSHPQPQPAPTADPYAALARTRAPLTDDDRREVGKTARVMAIAGVVALVFLTGFALALASALGDASDTARTIAGVVFGVPLLGMTAIVVWLVRRTKVDAGATEKTVYVGTVTAKRVEQVEAVARTEGSAHADVQTRHLLTLDGVDFAVNATHYGAVEPGQRAELHCLREREPFRVLRA